mgnify:FL=1
MRVITQAIRVIDYEKNRVLTRDIMSNFSEYIEQLIGYINSNTSVREYRTQTANTEVIAEILEIVQHQKEPDLVTSNVDMIANRLLRKEKEANERIIQLDTNVQKGSLILALIEDEASNLFLLAKVEHTDFFDDTDYSVKSGFSKDTKKIWKTCLFEIDDINAAQFGARIYSNTVAKYWWHDFLELEELQSDEMNTKKAFRSIETALNRNLKQTAPHDHMVIRNAMYLYFNSVKQFDYEDLLDQTIRRYTPDDMTEEIKKNLIEKLESLPREKGFDCQFISTPTVIKSKMRKTYEVYNGIQIRIPGGMKELKDIIRAQQDSDGKRYLKIRVNDENTYRVFEHHE